MVTGGAGFIGSHLCERLLSLSPGKLVVVDDFSLGKEENLSRVVGDSRVRVCREDASDLERMRDIMKQEGCDVVFNLAVLPLPQSLIQPKHTVDKNILITTTFCELLRENRYETLIHSSSSESYGSAIYVPMDESHPKEPLTPYAASKLACDHVVLSYAQTFGLDVGLARPFNTYGPRQNEKSYAGVIPLTISRILAGEPPIIYGDGKQTRDYTYVDDTVEGILGVYKCKEARRNVINIATGHEITIEHIINEIIRITGYDGEVLHLPERPGDVRRHRGDIRLAKRLFGFAPKVDFKTGLKRTVEWYRSGHQGDLALRTRHQSSKILAQDK